MPKSTSFSVAFDKFSSWFEDAKTEKSIIEPTAMCLSTVSDNGQPSSRMVLLKKFDHGGFCFFTNFNSRKARELKGNQKAALCFYWGVLGRQIRIEGEVEKVSENEADEYFLSRRRGSQIGAWSSQQSSELNNWQDLMDAIKINEEKYKDTAVPRPNHWSGYRLVPNLIEFWQEGEFRIHQREVFYVSGDSWLVKNLYP